MSDTSNNGTDRDAWEHAKRGDMAGKWHTWCADCGTKNHKKANECERCGYGNVENGELFGVGNRRNVGRPEYTSDGEEGVYERSVHTDKQQ
jgi:hypothetical protein